jgi:hypothetical protein
MIGGEAVILAFDVGLPGFFVTTVATTASISMNRVGDIMPGMIRGQEASST